jgi:hypothetical protein
VKRLTVRKVSRIHAAILAVQDTDDFRKNEYVYKTTHRLLNAVDELYSLAPDYGKEER